MPVGGLKALNEVTVRAFDLPTPASTEVCGLPAAALDAVAGALSPLQPLAELLQEVEAAIMATRQGRGARCACGGDEEARKRGHDGCEGRMGARGARGTRGARGATGEGRVKTESAAALRRAAVTESTHPVSAVGALSRSYFFCRRTVIELLSVSATSHYCFYPHMA